MATRPWERFEPGSPAVSGEAAPQGSAIRDDFNQNDGLLGHEPKVSDASKSRRLPARSRISGEKLFFLLATLCAQFAAIAYISFLWFAPRTDEDWRRIALADWISRSITLSSTVIQVAVAIQAGICTSILAAIAIENYQVTVPNSAFVSAIRFVNTDPITLLRPLIASFRPRALGTYILLILLVVTTIISQFASTALIADLSSTPSFTHGNTTQQLSYFSNLFKTPAQSELYISLSSKNAMTQPLPIIPTFGEKTGPSGGSGADIDDTGPIYRTYLPVTSSANRSQLRDYSGPALTVDHRVRCERPTLLNATTTVVISQAAGVSLLVRGRLKAGQNFPLLDIDPVHNLDGVNTVEQNYTYDANGKGVPYECFVPIRTSTDSSLLWTTVLCSSSLGRDQDLGQKLRAGGLFSQLFPDFGNRVSGAGHLIINVTETLLWREIVTGVTAQAALGPPKTTSDDKEWLQHHYEGKDMDLKTITGTLSYSLCFTGYSSATRMVDMSSTAPLKEETSISDDPTGYSLMTSSALNRKLGYQSKSAATQARGLMTIDSIANNPSKAEYYVQVANGVSDDLGTFTDGNVMLCVQCKCTTEYRETTDDPTNIRASPRFPNNGTGRTGMPCTTPYIDYINIFQNTLTNNGGHPAQALQAFMTALTMYQFYNNYLPYTDITMPVQMTSFINISAPTGRQGFAAVVAVLLIHLILIGTIIATFIRSTKLTVLSQSWYSTAQLCTPDLKETMRQAGSVPQGEVIKWADKMGDDKEMRRTFVGLGRVPGEERYGAVTRNSGD